MGLEAHLAAEAEAAKPEYLRQRPKFYYYYEWCKKRIHAHVSRPSLLSREWVKRAAQLASMLQGLEFAKDAVAYGRMVASRTPAFAHPLPGLCSTLSCRSL